MKYRFYLDPETGDPHVWRHSVTETEVEEAFERNIEDRQTDGAARARIGKTESGRCLRIIYRVFPDQILFITAYDLTGKALKAFKRRNKK